MKIRWKEKKGQLSLDDIYVIVVAHIKAPIQRKLQW